jgi:hypothetical protein
MEECLVPAHRNQHLQRLGVTIEMSKMRKVEVIFEQAEAKDASVADEG